MCSRGSTTCVTATGINEKTTPAEGLVHAAEPSSCLVLSNLLLQLLDLVLRLEDHGLLLGVPLLQAHLLHERLDLGVQRLHPGRVVHHHGLAALALDLPERRLERPMESRLVGYTHRLALFRDEREVVARGHAGLLAGLEDHLDALGGGNAELLHDIVALLGVVGDGRLVAARRDLQVLGRVQQSANFFCCSTKTSFTMSVSWDM